MLKNRDFCSPVDTVRPLSPALRHLILSAGGAAGLQASYLAPTYQWERVGLVGAIGSGVLAAAGQAVLEARKAPMELPSGVESYEVAGASEDNTLHTAGKAFDRIGSVYAGAAGVLGGVGVFQGPGLIVTRPQTSDLDVPLVRIRDGGSVFGSGTFTFSGLPANNATINLWGTVMTWKTVLTGANNEILIGATAAAAAENLRRAANGGPGRGTSYSTTTTVDRSATGAWALDDDHATVVTITSYLGGTAGNAQALTSSDANVVASGIGTLAGGVDGALAGGGTDFIEVVLTYVILQPK